jgi:2-hydroxy-3-oxopropionate reductase
MVGGEAADVEATRPVLDAISNTVVHVGQAGAGQTVKAANQLLTVVTIDVP